MNKSEHGKISSLVFEEKGHAEVSEQIMNAYNSGYISQEGLLGDIYDSNISQNNL